MGLCADHFSLDMFKPEKDQSGIKKLKSSAIPNCYSDNDGIDSISGQSSSFRIEIPKVSNKSFQPHENREKDQIEHENHPEIIGNEVLFSRGEEIKNYKKRTLVFSDNEDESMEWLTIEPPQQISQAAVETTNGSIELAQIKQDNLRLKVQNRNLKRENKQLQQEVYVLQQRLQRARISRDNYRTEKRSYEQENIDKFLEKYNCKEDVAKTMVKLQLHIPNAPYSEEEKELAKHMFYHSAAGYKVLRKSGCNLPHESSIKRWVAEFDVEPGFCDNIFDKIKQKLTKLPEEERLCALKWDELTIRNYEEFSEKLDYVEGLIDIGPLGRKNGKVKHAFFFCVDSINGKNPWRQPLAYFLPGESGMNSNEITSLLEICLKKLKETGAIVKMMTSDQCTNNQKAYKTMNITENNLAVDIDETKYYASYDFPHLIKRLLAQLRSHGKIYIGEEIIANYSDFIDTWEYDKTFNSSRLLTHISQAHVWPNAFEAMNVKRAFQVLGRRFSCAMKTAGEDPNGLKSHSWRQTADFILKMNDVIDACNAYYIVYEGSRKKPLSPKNPDVLQTLQDFVDWSSKWSTAPYETQNPSEMERSTMHPNEMPKKEKKQVLMKRPPCFQGLSMTVKVFVDLYENLRTDFENFEFACGLANQDSVEHLFSKLRQRGGFNPNPTARQIRLSFRHILNNGLVKGSEKANVNCEETYSLITPNTAISTKLNTDDSDSAHHFVQGALEEEEPEEHEEIVKGVNFIEDYEEEMDEFDENTLNKDISFYEKNAIRYFAGFVAQYTVRKTQCEDCRDLMMKTPMEPSNSGEEYIELREFEEPDEDAPNVTKLCRPTENFVKIVSIHLSGFQKFAEKLWASQNLLQKLCEKGLDFTNKYCPEWFNKTGKCYAHRIQSLQFLYKVKIHALARQHNQEAKMKSRNVKSRKMKNLTNQ